MPPFHPVGTFLIFGLGLLLAARGWPPPIAGPPAYVADPGAAAVLATPRDVRFGLNQAWEVPDAADDAGAGWSRLVFWWGALQPRGPADFNLFATGRDSYIDDEIARGRELAGVILNTPQWASTNGSPNGVPRNLYRPWDSRDNYWGQFVHRLATHYRGRIDTWIIWNEVDIREGQWRTWDGSVEDYVQLLQVAYRAIKDANPDARVLIFGSAWWHDRGAYLSQVLDALAADPQAAAFHHYFDVANLHMYSRASDIAYVIPWYHAQLQAHGIEDKPVWIGETNVVPYDDPLWPEAKSGYRASLDEQASYLIEAFAMYLALGVERIGVNRALDGADFAAGGEPFGLVRNDRSLRPAFTAFQVITRYFAGAESIRYLPTEPSGLTRVVFDRPGQRITVLWTMNSGPLPVAVEAAAPAALQVTKYGDAATVIPEGDVYHVVLPGATANSNELDPRDFVVGGDPIILVEPLDGDLVSAYRPLAVAPRPRTSAVVASRR